MDATCCFMRFGNNYFFISKKQHVICLGVWFIQERDNVSLLYFAIYTIPFSQTWHLGQKGKSIWPTNILNQGENFS